MILSSISQIIDSVRSIAIAIGIAHHFLSDWVTWFSWNGADLSEIYLFVRWKNPDWGAFPPTPPGDPDAPQTPCTRIEMHIKLQISMANI